MPSTTDLVQIHYHRPPDRYDLFVQRLLEWSPECVVTFMEHTPLASPMRVDGVTALEEGSPVIWFTYPGRWHDIGLFHLPDGTFTGTYANIITPVRFHDDLTWETTDLFLDVWVDAGGRPTLLDADEFEAALRHGFLGELLAADARREAERVLRQVAAGEWPPAPVPAWSLARARSRIADGT